jgi:hypothetical protein
MGIRMRIEVGSNEMSKSCQSFEVCLSGNVKFLSVGEEPLPSD